MTSIIGNIKRNSVKGLFSGIHSRWGIISPQPLHVNEGSNKFVNFPRLTPGSCKAVKDIAIAPSQSHYLKRAVLRKGNLFWHTPKTCAAAKDSVSLRHSASRRVLRKRNLFWHTPKTCAAVTLIELLAVIAIIGVLVLLGLPVFTKFSGNVRLKSAQSQVASILRMAQNLSVTRNTSYTVNIFPRDTSTPNRITITKTSGGTQEEKIWTAPSLIEIPDVSGSSGSVQTIVYSPYGTATPASSIHIIQKGTNISGSAYDPSGSYGSLSKGERVKCFTVTSDNTTGRTELYNYGRNSPWSSSDL